MPIDPKVATILGESNFPFTSDLTVKSLEPPVVPELDRIGERGVDCPSCNEPDESYVWYDEHWRLRPMRPTPLRGMVLLETRAHVDSFVDLPRGLIVELGPMIARVERAILGIGDVGRVHLNRWGDGGEHFHLWFIPRPLGAMQLRGAFITVWFDLLPELPDPVVDDALESIRVALG